MCSTARASKSNGLMGEIVRALAAQFDPGEGLECCPMALQHLAQGQYGFGYICKGLQHYRKGANTPLLVLGVNKAASLGLQQLSDALP